MANAWNAEYVLSAQDQTAAAFARVNKNLEGLSNQATEAGKKMEKGFKVGLALFLGTELMGALRKLGGEMFNIANATNKIDAGKLQAMHQSLDKAGQSFKSMASMIGAQLAPYIQMVADLFVQAMGDGEGFRRVMHAAFVGLVRAVGIFADAWRGIEVIWAGLKMAFTGLRLFIVNGLADIDRTIVDVANKLPGVHLKYSEGLQGAADSARAQFEQTRSDFDAIIMKPLPSAGMLEAVKQIDAASAKQGEALAAAAERQKAANKAAEDEEWRKNITISAMKVESDAKNEETEQERRDREHQAKMQEMGQFAWMEQAKYNLEQKSLKGRVAAAQGILGQAASLMQSNRKKEFEIGKAAAIANATISMFEGIGKSWEYGPILGPIFAALVGAAGMMNIRQIRSQQFGGGGAANVGATPSMSVGSTGLPDTGRSPAGVQEAPSLPMSSSSGGPQRNVVIRVEGDNGMVSMDWVRNKLAPAMQDAAGDGVKFMVA